MDGFYYDFDFSFRFSEENFAEVEAEMRKIVKENLQLRHFTTDRGRAEQLLKERKESYKLELLYGLPEDGEISFTSRANIWSCALDRMWLIPAPSRHSGFCPWRAHIGVAMKKIKC